MLAWLMSMRMGQGTFTACLVLDAVVRLYGHEGLFCESLGKSSSRRRRQTSAPGVGRRRQRERYATRLRANSSAPATCSWTSLWGSRCEMCETQPCVECQVPSVGTDSCIGHEEEPQCSDCAHGHPWAGGAHNALARGALPCLDVCEAAGCDGFARALAPNLTWGGGSLSFFADSACTKPLNHTAAALQMSGDCGTRVGPGLPRLPGAPIPVGHLAIGCNSSGYARVVFGATAASCRHARHSGGAAILRGASGRCEAVPGAGGVHFVAACGANASGRVRLK